jgi:DNA (cytosine-5)-methyltransferase 1
MGKINLLYVDLFCGAGGAGTGIESARFNGEKCAKVIACVDHDRTAIDSYAANHPDVLCFCADVRTLELSTLVEHLTAMKSLYPGAKIVLWASPECTNFTKAKGNARRNPESQMLVECLYRYIEAINPDFIYIENVREFVNYPDAYKNGYDPYIERKGLRFGRITDKIKDYGYAFDYRILNAANYGAYTSRERFFGIFVKGNLPIVFPQPTHSKRASNNLFSKTQKWKSVKDRISHSYDCISIFNNKRMSDKGLNDIYRGLKKFVEQGEYMFIVTHYSSLYNNSSINYPCPTLVCNSSPRLVKVELGDTHSISFDNTDKSILNNIKSYMIKHGISDIKTRPLTWYESMRIQGFPIDYILIGSASKRKKLIGNAVEVNMSRVLCEALVTELYEVGIFKLTT